MTERRLRRNRDPLPNRFETGRPRDGNQNRKKDRHVSQRREPAVAAIIWLGGSMAANPPAWTIARENAAHQATRAAAARRYAAQQATERAAAAYPAPSPAPVITVSRGS